MIINGKLKFIIASKLEEKLAIKLANIFEAKLEEIIIYCISKKKIEYTVSDLKDYIPYFVYNNNIKNNKLFLFPPAEGGAESYMNNVVTRIENKSLVLFNNYLLSMIEQYGENNTNYITFENLAQNYIQYIKLIQAKGPYNLFGWSFGGVLAFEIARQLSIKGEIVNNLFLLDPYFDYKKVVDKLGITTLENNINCKYSPKFVTAMTDTKIILFKATKVIPKIQNQESEDTRIANYFALKTKYNNLDHLVDRNSIERIPINSTHEALINNKFLLNYINKIEL